MESPGREEERRRGGRKIRNSPEKSLVDVWWSPTSLRGGKSGEVESPESFPLVFFKSNLETKQRAVKPHTHRSRITDHGSQSASKKFIHSSGTKWFIQLKVLDHRFIKDFVLETNLTQRLKVTVSRWQEIHALQGLNHFKSSKIDRSLHKKHERFAAYWIECSHSRLYVPYVCEHTRVCVKETHGVYKSHFFFRPTPRLWIVHTSSQAAARSSNDKPEVWHVWHDRNDMSRIGMKPKRKEAKQRFGEVGLYFLLIAYPYDVA